MCGASGRCLLPLCPSLIPGLLVWAFSFVNCRSRSIVDHHGWSARSAVAHRAFNDEFGLRPISHYHQWNMFLHDGSGKVGFVSTHWLNKDGGATPKVRSLSKGEDGER